MTHPKRGEHSNSDLKFPITWEIYIEISYIVTGNLQ